MPVTICVAGATGATGRAVAEGVLRAPDLVLYSSVARSAAGLDLGEAWGQQGIGVPVFGQVVDALDGVDVLVDYTSYASIRTHVDQALERGVHVVVGSSGLCAEDLSEIDRAAREHNVGVFAAGNFSITATLAQAAALMVARHLETWEIVDYASSRKPDSPSGTSRELAERLAEVRRPVYELPVELTGGSVEARGTTVAGTQIHSVRLPSYDLATEIIFGLPDERLVIRHVSNPGPEQFVAGTLLAIRAVTGFIGVERGMDALIAARDTGEKLT